MKFGVIVCANSFLNIFMKRHHKYYTMNAIGVSSGGSLLKNEALVYQYFIKDFCIYVHGYWPEVFVSCWVSAGFWYQDDVDLMK